MPEVAGSQPPDWPRVAQGPGPCTSRTCSGAKHRRAMATCMAPPWPSQRRSNGTGSERHSALARMRQRRDTRGALWEAVGSDGAGAKLTL
eukprot:Skav216749  [mRNA]  locus=scaffold3744:102912:104431:+ [translate_table: standard]